MDARATQLVLDLVALIDDRVALALEERCDSVNNDHGYLNVEDAAAYLACPKSRIYDLVQLRKLSPERDGKRLLFTRGDLDRYVCNGGSQ
jgi:excisionase family DNA binding protein